MCNDRPERNESDLDAWRHAYPNRKWFFSGSGLSADVPYPYPLALPHA